MVPEPNALVTTEWLHDHLDAPDIRVIDASWYMPDSGRDPRADYAEAHIPGAVFFDIDEIADTSSPYPHMLPSPEKFASRMRRLGLGDGNRLIVYDGLSIFGAARVWWMFRVMGHDDIAVLDGGFPKWRKEGRPIEDLPPVARERHFTARMDTTLVRDFDQIKANISGGPEQIIDARPAGRFAGRDPEPRPGLKSGHIPESVNLPYTDVLNGDGTLKSPEVLRAAFAAAGVDLDRPMVTTCGSGISAAVLALALYQLGHSRVAVYDGSWSEWGARDEAPAATGG